MEISTTIQEAFTAMSWWELIAVIFGVAYLLLAMYEKISCWYAALINTAIYTFLFWDVNLLMDSALQVYYMAMAFYGWWQWKYHPGIKEKSMPITCWRWQTHSAVIAMVVVVSLVSGWLLENTTEAAWPYLDSFTTWGAVVTTYMVAKKILENWIYWLVIDSVAVFLYIDRGLYLTAMLFMAYVVIVIFGFIQWRKTYLEEQTVCLTTA